MSNESPAATATTFRCVAFSRSSGTPSPSESPDCATATEDARTSARDAEAAKATRWGREHIRSLFYAFRSWRRHPATGCPLGLACLPRTGATSFADDFAERHAPVDLRDLDLDLVPDLRPRDEDHEVRDPRESIAFSSDILDLGLVDLPFLHRHVRRSVARPRIRHPSLHAAAPCRRLVSHPLHGI